LITPDILLFWRLKMDITSKRGGIPKWGIPTSKSLDQFIQLFSKKKGNPKNSIFLTISNYLIIFQPHFSSER